MDFFARQDSARRQTGLLLVYFAAAILVTSALVYFVILFGIQLLGFRPMLDADNNYAFVFWYPDVFLITFLTTLCVVCFGAFFKRSELSGGGADIAARMGGRPVLPDSSGFYEVRLRNVVEEMAIASGVPVPQIYVLDQESGINAFAAGHRPGDAVVAVTYGTMVGLTRDELQGVVAHEFSHILNGDMRLNFGLIGWLFGLTVIAMSGKGILRGMRHARGRGSGAVVLVGGGLFCVGSIGAACAGMIKSLISKQREYLADASAVQFTRNPGGLAGALKKIGGLAYGSRLNSHFTDEVSHMCFGNGLRGTMFPTHPPLKKRIQWLEPSFNGHFSKVTLDSIYVMLARTEGAPKPDRPAAAASNVYTSSLAGTPDPDFKYTLPKHRSADSPFYYESMGGGRGRARMESQPKERPVSPHALLESIGNPMMHHVETARALLASIPDELRNYAGSPHGARMLIYLILLDPEEAIRSRQMDLIKSTSDAEAVDLLEQALPATDRIEQKLRLPIVDLTIPALRFLSTAQYASFRQTVKALIHADEQVDIFEYVLQRVLTHHLDPLFLGQPRKRAANYYSIRGLVDETSVLLSVLARSGHAYGVEASSAFLAAESVIKDPKIELTLLDKEACSWDRMDAALDRLNEGSSQIKKLILSAVLTCMMHDRQISVEEVELFRAIAGGLDCPVPPWVTPVELDSR